jgi:DNA-binding XRE family transcriptional regulator
MAMIYAGGHLSGAHYNPSVTIAFTLARHFPIRDALAYIAAQSAPQPLSRLAGPWDSTPCSAARSPAPR